MEYAGTVSSAEITRNFGYWQSQTAKGPLAITHHGRPRCVLMTMDDWSAATGIEQDKDVSGLRRELEYHFLTEHMDGGLVVLDDQLCIREISSLAAVLLRRPATEVMGHSIEEIMPQFVLAAGALRHVLRTGEETQFDLPVEGRGHDHLRVRAFLWPRGVALILRASQEDVQDNRLAEHLALEKALTAHGVVISARLTVRGTIASAEPSLAALIDLPPEKITGARLVDLVAIPERTAVRRAVELALNGQGDIQRFDTRLLTNHGTEVPVRITIAPLTAGYAVGGAVMVLTVGNADGTAKMSA